MSKVVINSCYGGFSLNNAAKDLFMQLADDAELYTQEEIKSEFDFPLIEMDDFISDFFEPFHPLDVYKIPRHHPALIAVIEQLGDKATNEDSGVKFEIVDVTQIYAIKENDGLESILLRSQKPLFHEFFTRNQYYNLEWFNPHVVKEIKKLP